MTCKTIRMGKISIFMVFISTLIHCYIETYPYFCCVIYYAKNHIKFFKI